MAFKISALCNNARLSGGRLIGDPTDGALLVYAQKNGYSQEELEKEYPRILEIPLDSSRKRMTTVNEIKGKKYVLIKGAPEIIIERCKYIEGEVGLQPMTPDHKDRIFVDLLEMTLKSLRVLALAYKPIQDKKELQDLLSSYGFNLKTEEYNEFKKIVPLSKRPFYGKESEEG
jgi:Ca2+-transporting ATPase